MEQRTYKAYITFICQPKASFNLFIAAQHQELIKDDIITLNKRLSWQINHFDWGLLYMPINFSTAKLFIFINGLFANNKDFSS